jgi:hypothetical protein
MPQKGPYRIDKIEARNVTLTEIETGKTIHSHVELIRPLFLSEYRLLLKHNWDLNAHIEKHTEHNTHPPIFDFPSTPFSLEQVNKIEHTPPAEIEDEIDLETLFYPPPNHTTTLPQNTHTNTHTPPPPKPPDPYIPNPHIIDQFEPQINTLHAHLDLSKKFKHTILNNTNKLVTFFLSKHDQYIHKTQPHEEID